MLRNNEITATTNIHNFAFISTHIKKYEDFWFMLNKNFLSSSAVRSLKFKFKYKLGRKILIRH